MRATWISIYWEPESESFKESKSFFHCAEKKFEAMKFLLERYKYEVFEPRMKTNIIARTIEVVIQINIVGIV